MGLLGEQAKVLPIVPLFLNHYHS